MSGLLNLTRKEPLLQVPLVLGVILVMMAVGCTTQKASTPTNPTATPSLVELKVGAAIFIYIQNKVWVKYYY